MRRKGYSEGYSESEGYYSEDDTEGSLYCRVEVSVKRKMPLLPGEAMGVRNVRVRARRTEVRRQEKGRVSGLPRLASGTGRTWATGKRWKTAGASRLQWKYKVPPGKTQDW